jgi:trans-aconitate methyltransferase
MGTSNFRGTLTQTFRALGLMHLLDRMKFACQKWKNRRANALFKQERPEVALPPDYMLFEAFQLDYRKYYEGGEKTARWVLGHLAKHAPTDGKAILDWGCGPARVVRHLPNLLGPAARIHATDYNPRTVAWCQGHIPGVTFDLNQISPPTVYADGQFDLVYGISIFTHLSEANHRAWFEELMRIARPGAVLLLTLHGKVFKEKMSVSEQKMFDEGRLVVRGKVTEGHRIYAAFHPVEYVRSLFEQRAEVLEHIEGQARDWGLEQDVWLLRKK